MKKLIVAATSLLLATACAAPRDGAPGVEHGFNAAGTGIANLILSPIMIVAGLLEGISALPYLVSSGVHDMNRGFIDAQADITLDDTYEYAYGTRLQQVPETGDTGVVFRRMKHATEFFQNVLRGYGVPDSEDYILTSVKNANAQGYTLYAVVHRPANRMRVLDKYDRRSIRQFQRQDRLFYEPYVRDLEGRPLDTVIDWAGVSREAIKTQKGQAILLTLAANSVLNGKRSPDYWEVEERWLAGDFRQVVAERESYLRRRMGT